MHASLKCWQVFIKESNCVLRSFCVYESAKNEFKEDNNGLGYLFDVNISWIFFKTWTWHKLPPLLLNGLPTGTKLIRYIELQTVKLVLFDQPAQNILPPRQFCSLLGWQVKHSSNVAINFFTPHPQCIWHGVKDSDPIFWAHVRSNTRLTLPREMFIAQHLCYGY